MSAKDKLWRRLLARLIAAVMLGVGGGINMAILFCVVLFFKGQFHLVPEIFLDNTPGKYPELFPWLIGCGITGIALLSSALVKPHAAYIQVEV